MIIRMYNIQEIKDRIDCLSVAQRCNLPIRNAGDRCVSPLRAGATNKTSFVVYKDFWYDFGMAKGGDAIDLLAEIKYDGDKGAAIRELAREAGIETNVTDGWMEYTRNLCNQIAFYQTLLTPEDYNYLHSRGLTDDTIAALRIGRDRDGRLVIPYLKNNYVAYYCTRAMPGCNYPESKYRKMKIDAFNEHIVWGLDSLSRGSDTLIIAEGIFDAISFWQDGYPVLSAVTGFFSRDQIPSVLSAARSFKRVLIVYDNDKRSHAGDKFAARMAQTLIEQRIPFIVGHVPDEYKDISEYYEAGGDLRSIVINAVDGVQYLCDTFSQLDEIADFLKPLARTMDAIRLEMLFTSLKANGRFDTNELKVLKSVVKTVPQEVDITQEIIQNHGLLYAEGTGFYEWDGRVWRRISDETVRRYAGDAYGKQFTTAFRVSNVCKLAKSLALADVAFDQSPVLTFQNGTLELETGVFRDSNRNDYCSIIMDYDYDPDAACPTWDSFIQDVTNGDGIREENLQFIPGYALMPNCKYQKIFVLLGKGGNGKSVYLEVIQRLFGNKNVTHVEPTGLAQEFQRVLIKDSLLNIGSDINSDFSKGEIREWLLKIADGASVQACYKGMTHITFEPRCKLVYACNQVPTAEVINGLERRFLFINFPCSYVEDPNPNDPLQRKRDVDIIPKLLGELPGIFNWCYRGYKLLNRVGYFTETYEHADILNQFKAVSNPVEEFCSDRVFAGTMTRDEVYTWYRDWCDKVGHKPLSRTRFLPKFRDVMGREIADEQYIRTANGRNRVFVFVDGSRSGADEKTLSEPHYVP